MDFAADTVSTVIDTEAGPSASGGGQVPLADAGESDSLRSDLEAVFKADAKKAEPKPEKVEPAKVEKDEAKPDAKANEAPGKDEKAPEGDDKPGDDDQGEEGDKQADAKPEPKEAAEKDKGRYPEPPAKFLPDAKEHWRNVPRAVQRDIATMSAEHEREVGQYRESHQRYEPIKEFDDLARSNGRDLKYSLGRVVEIETTMARNPIAALEMVLRDAGPRKADGNPVSLYEMAEHIVRNGPEAFQQVVSQQQPQQQQAQREDPRITQLQQQLAEMQEQQLSATVIQPFAQSHPRYAELEQDIAFFLQSGRIPDSLSVQEKLEVAYDMADRLNPASHVPHIEADERLEPDLDRRADPSFSGSKSIKSAPGSVTQEVDDQAPGGESIRDTLRKEMRRLNR